MVPATEVESLPPPVKVIAVAPIVPSYSTPLATIVPVPVESKKSSI